MDGSARLAFQELGAVGVLVLLRAVTAAAEASLVAVGQPRALELGEVAGAGRRARCLAALARELDNDTGINHTMLVFDVSKTRMDDFGSKKSWDLSDTKPTYSFGLLFVF